MINAGLKNVISITKKDAEAIEQIALNVNTLNFAFILSILHRSIKNINENHIIYLGFVIGQIQATGQTLEKIYNNLQPCQRQN